MGILKAQNESFALNSQPKIRVILVASTFAFFLRLYQGLQMYFSPQTSLISQQHSYA